MNYQKKVSHSVAVSTDVPLHPSEITGAVLTQDQIEALMKKLDRVTTTLQEREKAKLKDKKVFYPTHLTSLSPLTQLVCVSIAGEWYIP